MDYPGDLALRDGGRFLVNFSDQGTNTRNPQTWWVPNPRVAETLKTHTPQIWEVEFHPPNLGGESSKNTCFAVFSGARSLNLAGEIFTPQIWGVWVLREGLRHGGLRSVVWQGSVVYYKRLQIPVTSNTLVRPQNSLAHGRLFQLPGC